MHLQVISYHSLEDISRVAEVGSLSARAKEAVKVFGKRIFTIFARNELFLRLIANLQN